MILSRSQRHPAAGNSFGAPSLPRRSAVAGAAAGLLGLTTPGRAQQQTIRIGVLTDMSSQYSANSGPGSVLASQLALEDFSKSHPDIKVELLSADLQLKPDVALAIAGDWFDNKGIDLITDVPLTSAAIAIGEMAKAKDKLAIFTGAASSILTGQRCGPNQLHWAWDSWAAPHAVVDSVVKGGGKTWFFVTPDYSYGTQLAGDAASFVTAAGGQVLGQARYPFPGTTDFSGFLLQAKASGAQVIALANGGTDAQNCIKQAAEFGLTQNGTKVVGIALTINDMVSLGLDAAQGSLVVEPYYWYLNEGTRALGRRFAARMKNGAMPNSGQAGQYSAIWHYLKAVADLGVPAAKASGLATLARMRAIPVEDPAYGRSSIRIDGQVTHNEYLFEAKSPAQSTEQWDVFNLRQTIPAEQAFRPLSEGGCPLVPA